MELISIFNGKVLDTPGFSDIDIDVYDKDKIKRSFVEFNKFSCPFKDCYHTNEKECLIKHAVSDGKILKSRYDNYIKFLNSK